MNNFRKFLFLTLISLGILSFLVLGLTIYRVYTINIIPNKYIIVLSLISALFIILSLILIPSKKLYKKIIGSLIILVVVISSFWTSFQMYGFASFLNNQTNIVKNDINEIRIVALKSSPYTNLESIRGKTVLISTKSDQGATLKLKENIITNNKIQLLYKESDSYLESVSNLYTHKVQLISINTKKLDEILKKYPKFNDDVKIIHSVVLNNSLSITSNISSIAKEPFSIFLSGNDSYGDLVDKGRSDVNIVATINPNTKNILLTSIPRDTYVKLPTIGKVYDKLTHASNLGIEASIKSIEHLLNIKISYYIRINFSSLIKIVNSIDGITVDNPQSFNTYDIGGLGYNFPMGELTLNGKQALAFVRERYYFGDERVRGQNQELVIKGIISKITRPDYIINLGNILSNLGNIYTTNLSNEEISSLIKSQLVNNDSWEIQSFNLNGAGITGQYGYMMPNHDLFYMLPYKVTRDYAKEYIDNTLEGKSFTIDESKYDPDDKTTLYNNLIN